MQLFSIDFQYNCFYLLYLYIYIYRILRLLIGIRLRHIKKDVSILKLLFNWNYEEETF